MTDEFARLAWLTGRVRCAPIRHFAREGDRAWLLTGAVAGLPAGAWLSRDPDALPRVVAGLARFLRVLHALPPDDCPFDSSASRWSPEARRRVASGLVDADDFAADHLGRSPAQVLGMVEALAVHARGRVIVHGDFTLATSSTRPGNRTAASMSGA